MNLFARYGALIKDHVQVLAAGRGAAGDLDFSKLAVEPPRDEAHGDISTNAAMVLAKQLGMPPRAMADALAKSLAAAQDVATAEIAGPGFINIRLKPSIWPQVLSAALQAGETFGRSQLGGGLKANVEYVSANPTGPLHVGHCRGAVFGDALANLLTQQATRSSRNITSTMPEHRSMFSPARVFFATARRSAKPSEKFRQDFIPVTI